MKNIHQKIEAYLPFILVVEDDPDDQLLLKVAFNNLRTNFSLHFVNNAQEAMHYLHTTANHELPDLIVLKYNLPGLNGLKLMHRLNTFDRFKEIEKVVLTNSSYFPIPGSGIVHTNKSYTMPDSFAGMIRLAEKLLQLCPVNEEYQVS